MNKEQKIEAVRELLRKFTDPKPEYDLITAYEVATKIVEALDKPIEE